MFLASSSFGLWWGIFQWWRNHCLLEGLCGLRHGVIWVLSNIEIQVIVCLFSLLNHRNKSIHSLISIIPNPVTLQWFLTITLFQLQSPDSITETIIPDLHTLSQMSELIFLMKRWNENWCCLRKYSL